MKPFFRLFAGLSFLLLNFSASATVRYVNANGTNPVAPYATWATAATNISDSGSNAAFGDTILVTNGVYQYGLGTFSTRVYLHSGVTLQSVNGPAVTTILGYQAPGNPNATNSVRCVTLAESAVLSGFTLQNGGAFEGNNIFGGGVSCQTTSSLVTNCIITGNGSSYEGGGVYGGTVINSIISGNSAPYAGGAYLSVLINCVVSNNTAYTGGGGGLTQCAATNCLIAANVSIGQGGGAYQGTLVNCTVVSNVSPSSSPGGSAYGAKLYNCIAYFNSPDNGGAYNSVTNCCVTPLPLTGANNFTNLPGFVNLSAGNYRLQIGSPCIDAGDGSYNLSSTDLDGNPRVANSNIDIGAYENAFIGTIHYVSLSSTNPVTPFLAWTNAATNIQAAVNAAASGDYVIVDAGVYTNDATVIYGSETNRVVLTNGVKLLSLNGPGSTLIVGGLQTRGVYVGSNSFLSGFTITNGQARLSGDIVKEQSGGGIWCEPGGAVSNCLVISNYAGSVANSSTTRMGGGIFGGAITNCVLTGNYGGSGGAGASNILSSCVLSNNVGTYGAGAFSSAIYNSVISSNYAIYNGQSGLGGGTYQCVVSNSSLLNNRAASYGGGSYLGTNFNCAIYSNNAVNGGGTYTATNFGCFISTNLATNQGGGSYAGYLYNCVVAGNMVTNSGSTGGGAYNAQVYNCTVVGNYGYQGSGLYNCTVYNSIVYYNNGSGGPANYDQGIFAYCCTTPAFGAACLTNNPALLDWTNGFYQLKCGSPCIDAGIPSPSINNPTNDLRGLPRPAPGSTRVDIGAYEYTTNVDAIPAIRNLSGYTNISTGFAISFAAEIAGCADYFWWDFGDGSVTVTNQSVTSHSWTRGGTFMVKLYTYYSSLGTAFSATTSVQVLPAIYYVNPASSSAIPPYATWATAARSIQPAINASTTPGRLVLVTNGTYISQGNIVYGSEYNSVILTNTVVIQSANGPSNTIIQGTASRCAYVGNNSLLSGFTLKNGYTISSGDTNKEQSGAGAWCEPGGVVSNCFIGNGSANFAGGGVFQGTVYNCVITNNRVNQYGGGTFASTVINCSISNNYAQFGGGVCAGLASNSIISSNTVSSYGGGACSNTLIGCVLSSNICTSSYIGYGGGAYDCLLTNCSLIGNSAAASGGGVYVGSLVQCLVIGNSSATGGGVVSGSPFPPTIMKNCIVYGNSASYANGGLFQGAVITAGYFYATNCIVFGNASPSNANYSTGILLVNCCTTPLPTNGSGNISANPLFVNTNVDFHLSSNSPCINAGLNSAVVTATDLDGNPRISGGTVDIGAYEFQSPTSVLSYVWAQQYGFATDGSADYADPDGDGMNNFQEWKAGTSPIDPASALRIASVSNAVSGTTVTWQSVTNITYYLQRSTNLIAQPPFTSIKSNLIGQLNLTSYLDANATNGGPYYYRVGVQ